MTPKSRTLGEDDIWLSSTLIDTPLKSVLNSRHLNIMNFVFESLIFFFFLIIHTLMSEMQLLSFAKDVKGSLLLNEIYTCRAMCHPHEYDSQYCVCL